MITPKDVFVAYRILLAVSAVLLMFGLDIFFPADIAFKMYWITPPGSEHLLTGWATFNAAPLISAALIVTNVPIVGYFFFQAVRLTRGIAAASSQKTSADDTIKKLLQHMTKWLMLSGLMIMVSSINWFWKATNLFDSGMENKAFFGFYYKGDLPISGYLFMEGLMVYGRLFTGWCQIMSVAPRDEKGKRQGFFARGRNIIGTRRSSFTSSRQSSMESGGSATSMGSQSSVSSRTSIVSSASNERKLSGGAIAPPGSSSKVAPEG